MPVPAWIAAAKVAATKIAGSKAAMQAGKFVQTFGPNLAIGALNRRAEERAFKQNREFWRERFDATNEYNTPLAQMQRMKEAGLNPALMYGGSGGAGAAPADMGSTDGKRAETYDINPQFALMSAQAKNIEADTELKKQNSLLALERAAHEVQKSGLTRQQKLQATERTKRIGSLLDTEVQIKSAEAITKQVEAAFADEKTRAQVNNIIQEAQERAARTKGFKYQNEVYEQTKKELVRAGVNPDSPILQQLLQAIFNDLPGRMLQNPFRYSR